MSLNNEIIKTINLTKKFNDFTAVNSISFNVYQGEIFAFLGRNGAGKTTTINIICTLLQPTSGEVFVDGKNVIKQPHDVRSEIGIIFQDPSLDERLTAYENMEFQAQLYKVKNYKEKILENLKIFDLHNQKNTLVKFFSGGMKRKLEIARGLLHSPKILFLDEPTLGLDAATRQHLWEHILNLKKNTGITVFMTTHYIHEANICDRIAIIDKGKIISIDEPTEMLKKWGEYQILIKTENNLQAKNYIKEKFNIDITEDNGLLEINLKAEGNVFADLIQKLPLKINFLEIKNSTLDDIFIKLTGSNIDDELNYEPVDKMRKFLKMKAR